MYRLVGFSTNENKTLFRYLIGAGDMSYLAVSPVPIKVREGFEVRFLKTGSSIYVIDDNGAIQELYDELRFLPQPPSKR